MESVEEFVGDLVDDNDPLGGHTALATVEYPTVPRPGHGLVDIGVGQRDQRVRTPQLHGGLLEVLARTRRDDGPGALAAGQRNSAHPRVVDEQRELILGGEQVGVGALWATGF